MQLRNKRVLITGGSSGIGFATAQVLGARGARLVVSGRRQDRVDAAVAALRQSGADAAGIAADVATQDGRARTLDHAVKSLGGSTS